MLPLRTILVTGAGAPPLAGTRYNGPLRSGPNTIVPSRFQVPPQAKKASQRTCTASLATSTVLSRASAKNPIWRLSGDQNGKLAPSVPLTCCAPEAERARTHKAVFPSDPRATNANWRPSGETAKLLGRKDEFGGGSNEARIDGTRMAGRSNKV